MPMVVTNTPRTDLKLVAELDKIGVATIHEAQGRIGLVASYMRPIYPGARVAGTAITVSLPPADNWMIHVAVEQCQEGDVLVVQPTSPSDAGYFGELLATSLVARGVRGLVLNGGCRDVGELTAMRFPVWSSAISAQGTVKESLGNVNIGMTCAGCFVHPGDVVIGDDDGVVFVRRQDAAKVLAASIAREKKEMEMRARLKAGEIGLDIYNMREAL